MASSIEPKIATNDPLVSTKDCDYLEEDPTLRGQNFVCLSFLSPENELKNKEVYTFQRFLTQFSKDMSMLFDNLAGKYPNDRAMLDQVKENNAYLFSESEMESQYKFFKSVHGEAIEKDFHAENNFRTTVRGIKVRGVFDTLKEAQVRAQVLKKMGDKFDIFIGQVGVWCPWSPNPEQLEQEYQETHLNTLMKKYKENMDLRDQLFNERKHSKITSAMNAMASSSLADSAADVPTTSDNNETMTRSMSVSLPKIEEEDGWSQQHRNE